MWKVYLYRGAVTQHFVECESDKAAEELCEAYGCTYLDEHGVEWGMDYREVCA